MGRHDEARGALEQTQAGQVAHGALQSIALGELLDPSFLCRAPG